jgi:hypothetical protein
VLGHQGCRNELEAFFPAAACLARQLVGMHGVMVGLSAALPADSVVPDAIYNVLKSIGTL